MTVQAINLVKASRASPAAADLTAHASSATAGDYFVNDGQTFLMVKNADGSDHTVTVAFGPGSAIDGVQPANVAHNVIAGHTVLIGPFPTAYYSDAAGLGQLSYSATTSMTLVAVQCPPAG